MAVTRGNIVTAIARFLHDEGMKDWGQTELQSIANDAICQTVLAARTHKEDVSLTVVAAIIDYSAEPCFQVTMAALGGQALDPIADGDPALAAWDSSVAGVPNAWRQQTGASIRVNPPPSAGAAAMIGDIDPTPTAGGAGYVVGDILTVTTGGTGGQVKVAAVDDTTAVTKLELIMRDRSTRGTGYAVGTGKATEGGSGSDCTVKITTLAKLEVTGYSGIDEPAEDAIQITAIPELFVKPTVVPLGVALALESRRAGTVNLELAQRKRAEWLAWCERLASYVRRKT